MTEVDVSIEDTSNATDTPPVVIVAPPAPDLTTTVMSLVERVTRLESIAEVTAIAVDEAISTAEAAQSIATMADNEAINASVEATHALEVALDAAEVAVETADETGVLDEVFAEVDAPTIEPDSTPRKSHWLFRTPDEWRQTIGKQ